MLIATFDPFVQEFDRLAQWVLGAADGAPAGRPFAVPMDAVQREGEVELRFDLPGVDPESLDVTVDRRALTVTARRAEEPAGDGKVIARERVRGSFSRRVVLADTVESDKIEATYANGVLVVRLPLSEKARPRRVEIQTGGRGEITA